ncbi:MAG TPA: amino acid adenylation domain-containing protein [Thermoanaerobaculia bacterium]|jgi:amino acid adenylation domain-containing protein|nr:amino acid adenylation domain-containing protein [Thermoanaerobaculia bacterium]
MRPENLESIYRLSPVQEGMLFHALKEPESGLYVRHLVVELSGTLEVERLKESWASLLERHAVLRTSFHWQEMAHPVQVVARRVPLPWDEQDWRRLSVEERQRSMAELLRADLLRGFDLAQPPLLRLTLVRTGEAGWELVWSFHHLILDGWSLLLLLREVLSGYAELCRGGKPALERVVPYKDFIAWQERRDGAAAERFWRQGLAGFSAPTPLPGVRPRGIPAASAERRSFEERGIELSVEATAALAGLAKRHGLTVNTLLQGAWSVLLSRSSREDDVVFGTTVSGRSAPLAGIESMVGLLINTLPRRVAVPGNVSLLPWLRDLQESASELLQHEHESLALVQGWSEVPRGLPLFDSIVVFQNLPIDEILGRSFVSSLPLRLAIRRGAEPLSYPLALIVFEGERLALRLSFERERVEPVAAERSLGHLQSLLAAMVANPGALLADLPLLSAAERQQVLLEWSRGGSGAVATAASGSLAARFAAVAAERPEAVAVVDEEAHLTYGELAARSQGLARWLRRSGVVPGERVGLQLERSPEMVVGILGVLAAGAAYVPLDPTYPEERLSFILADSGARIVVRQAEISAAAATSGGATGGGVSPGLDDLAYLIYTSGSTGRPKGVGVTHGNVLSLLGSTASGFGLGPQDVWTLFHSYAFDFSVWELWGALAFGGRLVVVPWSVSRTPEVFRELLLRERVTVLNQTPSAFGQLLGAGETAADLPSLRLVIFGGEVLEPRLLQPWIDRYGDERPRLVNMYGITETTVHATQRRLGRSDLGAGSRIGRPLADWAIYLLDGSGEPVPAGVAGEMFVGGAGVSRGYLGHPDLTAARFVPDPFAGSPGARLYRSGDLARHLLDGDLEYLGRIDGQVKVRGFRIEPGEIEAALASVAGVADAAVVLRRGLAGGDGLVAYAVAEPGAALAGPTLREHLKRRLPDYMVPAQVVLVESLPLTANGKLDRRRLAEQAPVSGVSEPEWRRPLTPAEQLLAGIFSQVLKVEEVGADSDFFALGGHSLLATQLLSRVREAFRVELPMRAIFEQPTVAGLAREIEKSASVTAPSAPSGRSERGSDLPLSFAQQRLWFLDQLEGGPLYNVPFALRMSGELSVAVLARVFAEVVRRHEVLRTVFRGDGYQPRQVILPPPAGFALPLVDLTALAPERRQPVAAERIAEEARRPFDLARGPLLRLGLFRVDATEHVLLLVLHHIVSDGWSLGVLVREVGTLYAAFRAGRPSPLPELAMQYADFAAWQRRHLAGGLLDAELAWWREQLAGMPPALELPADRPRPAERSTRGAVHNFALPSAGLAALSRRRGATLFMALLAGFMGLLQRWTGGEDLVAGTPVAGRSRVEIEPLIGFFVNTLVLRLDVSSGRSGGPTFLELLDRVGETALAAYAHQDVPFERLVEELAPERDRSRPPLVQVLFAFQNDPGALELPGLEIAASPVATGTAKLDLSCTLIASERGLAATIEYSRDLFDRTTVLRLADGFARLLAAAVEAPEARVADLPVLAPAERAALLWEWNDTAAAAPMAQKAPLVHELVAAWARRQPEALAVAAPGERLSYRELAARAGRLARRLGRRGAGPEVRVALCAGPTVHRVVGSLAVLLAGGAYVLLDPEAPPERLAFLVADSGAAVVLAERSLAGRFHGCAAALVELEDIAEDGEPGPLPDSPAGPENLAYIVYTSGSTGLPKGVAVSHAGLLNLVRWHSSTYGLIPGDRATLIANPAFDAAVWETWPCLAAGASLHIPEPETRFSPQAIVRFWRSAGITWSFLPTPLAEEVMALAPSRLSGLSLKGLLCGGDRLHRAPGVGLPFSLLNHYGPSEVSVVSTAATVLPESAGAPPIGRPIHNTRLRVADARGALVPRGAAGELWIGGAGLARGYLARPALTAERFLPDPWSGEPGERLYRTGDLVRYRADGNLEFLGRIDHQLKLRGFRIEPGEIEAALRAHPGVSEAVVTVLAPQRLVAYVVGVQADAPAAGELRGFLRERLPGYMVPAAYVLLPALPLTPHGKLDRKALPDPGGFGEPGQEGAVSTPPRTPAEERVAGIFAEALGVERVGVEDDFFALGGHSLLAAQVASRVGAAFGIELPVRSVFETPTVEGLAAWVERSAAPALSPLVRVSREQPLALSFAQQRLWFLERVEPGSPFFHLPAALDCRGLLDAGALARGLGEILRRHEVLRTRFALVGRHPVQIPLSLAEPAAAALLPCIDLSALPVQPSCQGSELARLTAEEARRPFAPERGSLLHAALVRLGPQSHRLLLTVHHIAADAWSIGLLIRELGQLYAAFAGGRPSPLPELAVQYADFAVWQRDRLHGERLDGLLRYWTGRLAPQPPRLELPTDRPRPPLQSHRGARRAVRLAAAPVDAMRRLGGPAGVTLFMALLAVFKAVLARHAGQDDVVVGTAVAERPDPALEPVIGHFLNTLVLRSDLSGDPAFRDLLERVRETVLGALAHAELPFERLVEALQPERDLSSSPLFQVLFALRNEPLPALDLPGLALTPADTAAEATQFDLVLSLEESAGGLGGWIEYNPDLFDGATMERLALHVAALLAGAVAAPGRRLSELPLLSEAESAQLLVQWNDSRLALPAAAASIHALFLAQVERTPDAIAVISGSAADAEASLTYRELADRASRLARRLAGSGVRPGDRVGVCVERSLPMLISLLAILQAGAAYVPLDPAYPPARLAAMLEDSQAAALLAAASAGTAGAALRHPRTLDPAADLAAIELEGASAPLPAPLAASAAYILYTSGSTGVPKGVVVSHANACNLFAAMDVVLRSQAPGVWLAVTSICFDISVVELLWTLTRGFKIVLHDGAGTMDQMAEQIGRHGVTHFQCTPSMATMLAASPERLRALAPLSHVVLGGEALPASLAARLVGAVEGEVRNLYGPTETTVWSLGQRLPGEGKPEEKPLIGRPLANTEAYLLDAFLQPVPLGSCGELFLGGEGVAAGYLRRPDLTAERFLPDPLGSRPGGRLYRTGDLARHLPDGRLDFIGRADHQVKVRGVRIELGEIEAALRAHPAVAQAVAAVREDTPGDRRLVAYLVPAAGGAESDLAVGALRRHLAARLPEAMIPAAFVLLAALPLTPNGKIDRRALPAPEAGRPRLDSDYAAPRTPGEKTLAAVWQEVLGRERIGIHDNFFELGGSSLLLVEIESRLREVLGREIPFVQIFRHPTIHGLAQAVEAAERGPAEPAESLRPPAGGPVAEGSALDRQRQFLAEMKRQRARQRRPGR